MIALVCLAGEIRDYEAFAQAADTADLIVCADGGAKHLKKIGKEPHILLGDFDSLPEEELEEYRKKSVDIYSYPSEKKDTDGSLCLKKVQEYCPDKIRVWGAVGKRIDHSYANLLLLDKFRNAVLEDGDFLVRFFKSGDMIPMDKNYYVSLFPLTKEVKGIRVRGLKYIPPKGILRRKDPIGISNEFTDDAVIVYETGKLLVFLVKKD